MVHWIFSWIFNWMEVFAHTLLSNHVIACTSMQSLLSKAYSVDTSVEHFYDFVFVRSIRTREISSPSNTKTKKERVFVFVFLRSISNGLSLNFYFAATNLGARISRYPTKRISRNSHKTYVRRVSNPSLETTFRANANH